MVIEVVTHVQHRIRKKKTNMMTLCDKKEVGNHILFQDVWEISPNKKKVLKQ